MYEGTAILKKEHTDRYDEYGNPVTAVEETEVFVAPCAVYSSEFYSAAQTGLNPSLTLFISNREDYNDEKLLEYEGKEYEVIRVDWKAQRDGIYLICQPRVGDTE